MLVCESMLPRVLSYSYKSRKADVAILTEKPRQALSKIREKGTRKRYRRLAKDQRQVDSCHKIGSHKVDFLTESSPFEQTKRW